MDRAVELGYNIIRNKSELEDANKAKLPLLGLFAQSHMSYEIDRDPNVEPSLSEMLQHALDLLNKVCSMNLINWHQRHWPILPN